MTAHRATQMRILRQARLAIETDQARHICVAIDNIAAGDHRRAIQKHCAHLVQRFKTGLDGRDSLPGWFIEQRLHQHVNPNTLVLARLAWIDRTIEDLAK